MKEAQNSAEAGKFQKIQTQSFKPRAYVIKYHHRLMIDYKQLFYNVHYSLNVFKKCKVVFTFSLCSDIELQVYSISCAKFSHILSIPPR